MRSPQKQLRDQVIVITGASSGIGLATARLAAENGARLVLSSRNAMALDKICRELTRAGTEAVPVVADVADRNDIERIAGAAIRHFGGFDTWVNNAGVTIFGELTELPIRDERRLFDVNFWGVVNGSLVALPHLKKHGGTLINIGSVLSNRALPLQGTYSASKHAVKAFTDALRMELEKEKAPVVVSLIKPASIDTPLPSHARNYTGHEVKLPPPYYTPEVVARAVLHCASHKHRDVIVGGGGAMLIWMEKLMPSLTDLILRKIGYAQQLAPGRSPRRQDSLYEPFGSETETRGGYPGHVATNSIYARLRLHSTGLALTAASLAALVISAALMKSSPEPDGARKASGFRGIHFIRNGRPSGQHPGPIARR